MVVQMDIAIVTGVVNMPDRHYGLGTKGLYTTWKASLTLTKAFSVFSIDFNIQSDALFRSVFKILSNIYDETCWESN